MWDDGDGASGVRCGGEMCVRTAGQDPEEVRLDCLVRAECLAEALDARIAWGVWGGLTEQQRRAVARKRPNVTSWRRILEATRAEQRAEQRAEPPAGQLAARHPAQHASRHAGRQRLTERGPVMHSA